MVDLSEFEEMYLKRIYEIYDLEPSTIEKTSQLAKIMKSPTHLHRDDTRLSR